MSCCQCFAASAVSLSILEISKAMSLHTLLSLENLGSSLHRKNIDTITLQSVQLDPCLDDCVMFAKKLKKLGVSVSLDVVGGLPHGFLNFSQVG
jgi:acetyl esterase/lipase